MISEHSAVGDSQGNGFIERAVRTNIEARPGGSHLTNLEDHSLSDSVVDRTCSRHGQQDSGRSRWENKFRTCPRETIQLETFSVLPVRFR